MMFKNIPLSGRIPHEKKKSRLFTIALLCGMMFFCGLVPVGVMGAELKLHFINVGLGDGIFIEYPGEKETSVEVKMVEDEEPESGEIVEEELPENMEEEPESDINPYEDNKQHFMVIDAGSSGSTSCWSYTTAIDIIGYIKTITQEYYNSAKEDHDIIHNVVVTHPHEDHNKYIPKLSEKFNIKRVHKTGPSPPTTNNFSHMSFESNPRFSIFSKYNSNNSAVEKMPLTFQMDIIAAPKESKDMNGYSAVIRLMDESKKFIAFFTGDATDHVWGKMDHEHLSYKNGSYTKLLKLPHHGSDSHGSNDAKIFKKIQPNIVIISSGINSTYKIPKCNRICEDNSNFKDPKKNSIHLGQGLLGSTTTSNSLYDLVDNSIHCYLRTDDTRENITTETPQKEKKTFTGSIPANYRNYCEKIFKNKKPALVRTTIKKAIFSTCTHGTIVVTPKENGDVEIYLPDFFNTTYLCSQTGSKTITKTTTETTTKNITTGTCMKISGENFGEIMNTPLASELDKEENINGEDPVIWEDIKNRIRRRRRIRIQKNRIKIIRNKDNNRIIIQKLIKKRNDISSRKKRKSLEPELEPETELEPEQTRKKRRINQDQERD
ncbi:MAG: hypothetical protein GY754_20715 [bacterium]|nr:hypothetical protein [bacterium]